ncbi:Uncharacterised protein [Dermatophilus congolensis]|uniref:Cytidylate kinase n=1 Tax=Dermatophilus congolensis TaxID=1863 RepID=A0AA46H0L9_9MICO|nr:cytidylate kinase family protein [Dermatophilus congolensis]STD10367.1 Uncharacterised protein [Dermatophilus congolensis]
MGGNSAQERMGLPLVTLFAFSGAGAKRIGPAVAGELGVPWVCQMPDEDGEQELAQPSSGLRHLREVFTRAAGPLSVESMHEQAAQQQDWLSGQVCAGAVVLGYNATFICRDVPGALHVKVVAPWEDRIDRLVATHTIPRDLAQERAARRDRLGVEMAQGMWGWDPRQDEHFDVVLNSSSLGVDGCVEIIVTLARVRAAQCEADGA